MGVGGVGLSLIPGAAGTVAPGTACSGPFFRIKHDVQTPLSTDQALPQERSSILGRHRSPQSSSMVDPWWTLASSANTCSVQAVLSFLTTRVLDTGNPTLVPFPLHQP